MLLSNRWSRPGRARLAWPAALVLAAPLVAAMAAPSTPVAAASLAAAPSGPALRSAMPGTEHSTAQYNTFHYIHATPAMRDGVHLDVSIWVPDVPAGVKIPVILTLTPYNVLNFPTGVDPTTLPDSQASWFVPRGYARAFADVRGTRNSEGCYDYGGAGERHDGYDLVEWLAAQTWTNGGADGVPVGMVGTSYEGTTANAAAREHPRTSRRSSRSPRSTSGTTTPTSSARATSSTARWPPTRASTPRWASPTASG